MLRFGDCEAFGAFALWGGGVDLRLGCRLKFVFHLGTSNQSLSNFVVVKQPRVIPEGSCKCSAAPS